MTAPESDKRKVGYVRLGKSGLKVSKVILGTMQYGSKEWQDWLLGEEEAIKHIKVAYDAGIQTFDTANVYSNGLSEIILGKAIKQLQLPRDEIVVMTKVYATVAKKPSINFVWAAQNPDEYGYVNQHGLSRKHIFESVKHSLERLQLDYIDLLQCHRFDPDTPFEETMQALHDVVQAGLVRYIGMSSCYAWQFHAMQNYAITNKLTPFISMQNHYNLLYREEEREMFPTLKHFGVGAIPWSPLARGLTTRPLSENTMVQTAYWPPILCKEIRLNIFQKKFGRGLLADLAAAQNRRPVGRLHHTRGETDWFIKHYLKGPGTSDIIARIEEVAKKRGISMAQVNVAWVLSREGVSAPIGGTTSLKNLEDIINGTNITLTEEIKYIEEAYKPMHVIGHS